MMDEFHSKEALFAGAQIRRESQNVLSQQYSTLKTSDVANLNQSKKTTNIKSSDEEFKVSPTFLSI